LPLGGMIDAIVKGPMDELAKAIDGKDEVAFDAAYEKLTEGSILLKRFLTLAADRRQRNQQAERERGDQQAEADRPL
jgi:hypothetical protein